MSEDIKQGDSTIVSMDWREAVPESAREWDEFKNSDTAEKFFDQIGHMRTHLGNSLRVPSEDAGEETWSEFYEKVQRKAPELMRKPNVDDDSVMSEVFGSLGKPDTPAKYDLPEFDDYSVSEERAQTLKEMAHKANLTKKQFKAMLGEMLSVERETGIAGNEAFEADRKSLLSEWGEAVESRTNIAAKVAEQTGAPEALVKAVQEGRADKATMQWLYGLSKQMTVEGSPMADEIAHVDSPADIQGKIDDMMNNQSHPYWDSSHPQHSAAVEKMIELRRKLAA